jgi:DNA-binding transcriptional ArsR family regulator
MKSLLAALLAAMATLAAFAAAQAPNAQEVANETVEKGKSAIDGVLGGAEEALPGGVVGGGGNGAGGDAGSGFARFLQAVAEGAAAAASATGKALGDTGAWIATGLAGGATAGVAALGTGLASLGSVLSVAVGATGDGIAAAAAFVAALLGTLLALYASFVSSVRPAAMPEPAFVALAAAGAAGSAAAAGYGLWALVKKYAWLLAGAAPLFSRIEDSRLLDHPLRAQVFQVIQQNPGIHASELSRKVGAGWGTIVHHLDKLEKGRLVTARRVNNQKCFFEDGGKVSRQDMAIAGAVRGDSASLITAYVTAHPMTSQKAMAEELGMSPALASFHVKKLAGLGVLDKVRRGKETLLTATQAVRRVLPAAAAPLPTAVPA